MKKTQWVLGKHSIRGWNMALSCLNAANWSANMNLGVTMSRQRLESDYFWAPPSPWILWDGFLQSENYSAAIKVSPPFGQIKGPGRTLEDLWAQKVILRSSKDSNETSFGAHHRPFCKAAKATKDKSGWWALRAQVTMTAGCSLFNSNPQISLIQF